MSGRCSGTAEPLRLEQVPQAGVPEILDGLLRDAARLAGRSRALTQGRRQRPSLLLQGLGSSRIGPGFVHLCHDGSSLVAVENTNQAVAVQLPTAFLLRAWSVGVGRVMTMVPWSSISETSGDAIARTDWVRATTDDPTAQADLPPSVVLPNWSSNIASLVDLIAFLFKIALN